MDSVYNGFDQTVQQQIKDYLNPQVPVSESVNQSKPPLEDWQKYMENGEYLRSSEMTEEQNYNMIDGRRNNTAPKKMGRVSVLARLQKKQMEIAKRSGKDAPQMATTTEAEVSTDTMERRRN